MRVRRAGRGGAGVLAYLATRPVRAGWRGAEGRKEWVGERVMGGCRGTGECNGREGPGGSSPALGKTAAAAERTLTLAAAAVRRRRRRGGVEAGSLVTECGSGEWTGGKAGSTSSVGDGWDGMGWDGRVFSLSPSVAFLVSHFLRRGPREKL
jgi:hypothetical protein